MIGKAQGSPASLPNSKPYNIVGRGLPFLSL